jgi:son of sevenless-like protein
MIKPPSDLIESELVEWKEKKETPVRLRVFNIMKTWIEIYCEDYPEDRKVLQEMKEFAATTMSDISFASNQIVKLAEKREGSVGPMRVPVAS